jgi:hypothetical protein
MIWACLATLKLHHIPTSDEILQVDLSNLLTFCRSSTKLEDQNIQQLIQNIDLTLREHKQRTIHSGSTHWSASMTVHGRAAICGFIGSEHLVHLQKTANIVTFAARNGLVQYLRLISRSDGSTLPSRDALVLHALESWCDRRCNPSRQERAETLDFLLKSITPPWFTVYGQTYFRYGLIVADQLLNEHSPFDSGELLRVFLLAGKTQSSSFSDPALLADACRIVRGLVCYKSPKSAGIDNSFDLEAIRLGNELEQLALTDVVPKINLPRTIYRNTHRYTACSQTISINTRTRSKVRRIPSMISTCQ